MSLHSDFFPAGGDDLIPGDVVDTPSNYIADGINYIDITDGVLVDKSLYPDLDANLLVPDWNNSVYDQEITHPTATSIAYFGNIVKMQGDTLLVGAYQEVIAPASAAAGSAHVFRRIAGVWTLEQTFTNDTFATNDYFAYGLDLDQNTIAIGAYGVDNGEVHVYTRTDSNDTTWTLEQIIVAPQPHSFGWSVALQGDTLVVGAAQETNTNTNDGGVYVYSRSGTTWTLDQHILHPNSNDSETFGSSVALDNDTIFVGSQGDDGQSAVLNTGSGFIYRNISGTWTLEQEISNPAPAVSDQFGRGSSIVKIINNTLVVGVPYASVDATSAGRVYIFERSGSTWTLIQTLLNPQAATDGDYFGYSIDFNDSYLVVGATGSNTGATDAGSVYIYEKVGSSWNLSATIDNPSPVAYDNFGSSVAMEGNYISIGCHRDDTTGSDVGRVYFYDSGDLNTFYIQGQDKVLKVK